MVRLRGLFGAGVMLALLTACGGGTSSLTPQAFSPARVARHATPVVRPAAGFKVLYNFGKGSDGAYPEGYPLLVGGKIYGTTYCGGAYGTSTCTASGTGGGTVFVINVDGSGEKVLHSFNKGTDGSSPDAGLIAIKDTLYTTTLYGGANGSGTVVAVTTAGKEHVVYNFKGGSKDGANPYGPVVDVNGTLYGLTYNGGGGQGCGSNYCGTVFSVTPAGKEKVVHAFDESKGDGGFPAAGLLDEGGTLYGATSAGGADGKGTFFSVTPAGAEKVLYSFTGTSDGGYPASAPIDVKGTFYATSASGGICGSKTCNGTVYSITTKGVEKAIYAFKAGSDGANPYDALVAVNGTLYGDTLAGGSTGDGTAFSVTTGGKESLLNTFTGRSGGAEPYGGLLYSGGKLYGFTVFGGTQHASGGGGGTFFVVNK